MKNLVIIGAGDLGKEIVWLVEDINKVMPRYLILGFLDDDPDKLGEEFYGYRVLGGSERLEELNEKSQIYAVIAIQDGTIRRRIVSEHPEFTRWETIIHPSAVVSSSSTVGMGSILFPQVSVSVDSRLGCFGVYYIRATVCNDCCVGNYTSLMCGASVLEHAEIGEECFLSAGSCVYPHVRLDNRIQIAVKEAVMEDRKDSALNA